MKEGESKLSPPLRISSGSWRENKKEIVLGGVGSFHRDFLIRDRWQESPGCYKPLDHRATEKGK